MYSAAAAACEAGSLMLPVVVDVSAGSAWSAAAYIELNVAGSIWNGPVADPPDPFGMFVHWLSIVHIAPSAVAFTPSACASLTAVGPQLWPNIVLSALPPLPIPPPVVLPPTVEPSAPTEPSPANPAEPALELDGSTAPANGLSVPGGDRDQRHTWLGERRLHLDRRPAERCRRLTLRTARHQHRQTRRAQENARSRGAPRRRTIQAHAAFPEEKAQRPVSACERRHLQTRHHSPPSQTKLRGVCRQIVVSRSSLKEITFPTPS